MEQDKVEQIVTDFNQMNIMTPNGNNQVILSQIEEEEAQIIPKFNSKLTDEDEYYKTVSAQASKPSSQGA